MDSETAAGEVARATDEKAIDAQFLTTEMYADQDDLAVRIRTHELYTTPTIDFAQWVLEHADWDGSQIVLDIGCGNGMYFGPLGERAGLVLGADLSFGMLQDASSRALPERVVCINSDAMRIPLPDGCCDRVLANHMLYHVPDILAALREMRRVLRPDGVLLTTTNARLAMRRFFDEILGACATLGHQFSLPEAPIVHRFSLDDGATLLGQVFVHVTRYQLESKLVFPTPEPALAYIHSMRSVYGNQLPSGLSWDRLMAQVETQIRVVVERDGAYQVPKTTGLFAARLLDQDG